MSKQKKHSSLQQLIRTSFLRLTAIVSVSFAIATISLISFTENKLLIPHLQQDFELLIQTHAKQPGTIINIYNDSAFYRVDDNNMDKLPDHLKDLDVGSHEVIMLQEAFHVLVKEDAHYRYLYEINQSGFERIEQLIAGIIIIAMLLSWGVSILAGRMLSKRIVIPIQQLSDKIQHIDHEITSVNLIDDFTNDEIGQLARYFDQYHQKIHEFLMRERMFTSDVSHEFRTPLMVISSSCEILLTQYEENSISYSHLLKIQSACHEMIKLVSIFLALARNDQLDARLEKAEVILKQQFNNWLPIATAKGLLLTFTINSKPEQPYSEEFLSIITSNLLRNAINYTLTGQIQIILDKEGFSINDTGTGIPDEIQNTVFEPFVRANHSQTNGIGLGLSIVKRICEKQGWHIRLQNRKEQGTSINIIF